MSNFRKSPTEKDIIERLRQGQLELPPLRLELTKIQPVLPNDRRCDIAIQAIWKDQAATFAVECKSLSTPKAFQQAVRQCQASGLPNDYLPMIILPYLGDSQLRDLEALGVSGVDLCGNGVVIVPGQFCVFRTGAKNQFPSSAPIKNVYRKNTSMVARALLVQPDYEEVQQLREQINRLNVLVARWGKTAMSPSTVSKALKGLEDDLVIDRSEGVRLLQPEKLIDLLRDSYQQPRIGNRIRMKIDCPWDDIPNFVRETADAVTVPVVATGWASVRRYAVMQRDKVLSVYCPRSTALLEELRGKEDARFPNVELLETDEQPVYFDAREDDGFLWASPLQTYLELATGDKRDRETAEQVRSYLLNLLAGEPR